MPGFATPPEILAFHVGREIRPSFSWHDVTAHERAHFFVAAKATDPALLDLLKSAIGEALEAGQGVDNWCRALLPRLETIGWDRPRIVEDPLGRRAPETVDFTDERRLGSVFWASVKLARAAREWSCARRTARALPFMLYGGPAPVHPASGHGAWAGLILPVEHPWWDRHWPPNGWGCTCYLRQITARERDRLLAAGTGPNGEAYRTDPPPDAPVAFFNARTGRRHILPAGVDFGWDGNPGLDRGRSLGGDR